MITISVPSVAVKSDETVPLMGWLLLGGLVDPCLLGQAWRLGPAAELLGVLCVGAVAQHKGQDVLIAALSQLVGLAWTCTLVGPESAPFSVGLRDCTAAAGIADRHGRILTHIGVSASRTKYHFRRK